MTTPTRPSVEKVGTSKSTIILVGVLLLLGLFALELFTGFLPEMAPIFESDRLKMKDIKKQGEKKLADYIHQLETFDLAQQRQALEAQTATMEGQFESPETALKKIEEQYSQQQPTAEDVARALQGISNRLRAQAE